MTIAAAASALAFASPAAAQYFPVAPAYAYPYHRDHGSYGQVRWLQARIDQLQWRIHHLDRRNILSEREARQLRSSRQRQRAVVYIQFGKNKFVELR